MHTFYQMGKKYAFASPPGGRDLLNLVVGKGRELKST